MMNHPSANQNPWTLWETTSWVCVLLCESIARLTKNVAAEFLFSWLNPWWSIMPPRTTNIRHCDAHASPSLHNHYTSITPLSNPCYNTMTIPLYNHHPTITPSILSESCHNLTISRISHHSNTMTSPLWSIIAPLHPHGWVHHGS